MTTILVSTSDGVRTFDGEGRPGPVHHAGRPVTTVAPSGPEVWAVVERSELWHTVDLDRWSHEADLAGQRATCLAVVDGDVLVGTSDARLFRLSGRGLEAVAAFDRAEGRDRWYTPWGGPPDTRSIANWDETTYVNVHVGGILRTEDRGRTWTSTIDIDEDVHQVTTTEELLLAACAGGLASSADRGASWTLRSDGLAARYSRAVAVCGDRVLLSASNGPRGGRAAIYRGDLGGGELERCTRGLTEWFDDNIDTSWLDALPDGSFAAFATSDGRVFVSGDCGAGWAEIVSGLPRVTRLLVLP